MSFTADWLALREPADRAARAEPALERAIAALDGASRPLIVDLGCGTGASLRALAGAAPADARWRLVDADAELLSMAERQAESLGVTAEIRRMDLAATQEAATLEEAVADADLVIASAFFDLVSADWIDRLATATPPGATLYAALSYDGAERWTPPHADDAAVLAAINSHQRRDKGFGPALGPEAWRRLAERLRADGRRVEVWSSPWRLTRPEHAALMDELRRGVASAAAEAGVDSAAWAAAPCATCEIGHRDLVAGPSGAPAEKWEPVFGPAGATT